MVLKVIRGYQDQRVTLEREDPLVFKVLLALQEQRECLGIVARQVRGVCLEYQGLGALLGRQASQDFLVLRVTLEIQVLLAQLAWQLRASVDPLVLQVLLVREATMENLVSQGPPGLPAPPAKQSCLMAS